MATRANVKSVERLKSFRIDLAKFKEALGHILQSAIKQASLFRDRLVKAQDKLQRELQEALKQLETCRHAVEQCQTAVSLHAEDELRNRNRCDNEIRALAMANMRVSRIRSRLDRIRMHRLQMDAAITRLEQSYHNLIFGPGNKADHVLQRIIASLDRYLDLDSPRGDEIVLSELIVSAFDGSGGSSEVSTDTRRPSATTLHPLSDDAITHGQATEAVERLQEIPNIRHSDWVRLDIQERKTLLQSIEKTMSSVQGRESKKIIFQTMEEEGRFNYRKNRIMINKDRLYGNDSLSYYQLMDTVIHEGRHAFQYHVIQNPDLLEDQALVEVWRENFKCYFDYNVFGWDRYANQPLEADAFHYAEEILNQIVPNLER